MKLLHWIGSSKKDLIVMPDEVQSKFGHTLYLLKEAEQEHEKWKATNR